jgi:hypothetical protein
MKAPCRIQTELSYEFWQQETSTSFPREHFGEFPTVNIPDCNMEEIGHYIDHQLKEKDLLQGKDPETVKLRGSICEKLSNLVEGDYFKVRTAINKINDLVASDGSASEVESILKEAGQSGEEIAQHVVNAANQALNAKEIDEVNEILIWGIYGEVYFDVDDMQSALVSFEFSFHRTCSVPRSFESCR